MKPQRVINIKQKFQELDVSLDEISLGDFDYIGEITVKSMRDPQSELWRKVGAFFKPNLERGLLIYSLIKKYKLDSYLEVGFGRGYTALCAAKAFSELNNSGTVNVVEPNINDQHMQMIGSVFPEEWTTRLQIAKLHPEDALPKLQDKYDLVYVDGNPSMLTARSNWEGVKDRWNCFCLINNYQIDSQGDPNVQVAQALDEVAQPEQTDSDLLIMDRRIFPDDRNWSDDMIKGGQLLLTRPSSLENRGKEVAFKETWDW
jgi:hypothetical protein